MARLAPVPAARDLPAGRHQLHKERLMRHILHDIEQARTGEGSGLGQRAGRDEKARRPWPLRSAVLVPALTAAALALSAVTVALPVVRHHLSTTESQPGVNAPVIAVQPGSAQGLAVLMDRIATVAASQPAVPVRANQFIYVKSEVAFAQESMQKSFQGPWKMDRLHQREVWLPQDLTRTGLIRENGKDITQHPAPGQPGIYNPTYQWLASLPTDPAALLKQIYADTNGHGAGPDDEAFNMIGELLRESIIAPKVNAALYRAAARIPGVVIVPDSVDAAGRHGLGIARVDDTGQRDEWIFDKKSLTYLGERDYLARDTDNGKAGMLVGTTAVLARGVADQIGQTAVRTS
ncbi:CU044_5270 family protein [Pseudonocardia sp.]|uniref:CU044_5270 family protein n=1 Tax=Pseudonocardia sp. TaxID=60912 RepID=UPI0031FC82DE